MTLSAEVWLMIAVVGLYLYDSALLVFSNEMLFSPSLGGGWSVRFGSSHFGLRGKEIFIPNPLAFHWPIYRLSWSYERDTPTAAFDAARRLGRPVAPLLWTLACGLFVLLPLGFFSHFGDRALLAALIFIFGSVLGALVWLALQRRALQLSWRRFAGLAFESIICPPFALNLIRHLSLDKPFATDAVQAARQVCTTTQWPQIRQALLARLDDEIDSEAEGSARHQALRQRREQLSQENLPCPE